MLSVKKEKVSINKNWHPKLLVKVDKHMQHL